MLMGGREGRRKGGREGDKKKEGKVTDRGREGGREDETNRLCRNGLIEVTTAVSFGLVVEGPPAVLRVEAGREGRRGGGRGRIKEGEGGREGKKDTKHTVDAGMV